MINSLRKKIGINKYKQTTFSKLLCLFIELNFVKKDINNQIKTFL